VTTSPSDNPTRSHPRDLLVSLLLLGNLFEAACLYVLSVVAGYDAAHRVLIVLAALTILVWGGQLLLAVRAARLGRTGRRLAMVARLVNVGIAAALFAVAVAMFVAWLSGW
jgi:hypothetical protein